MKRRFLNPVPLALVTTVVLWASAFVGIRIGLTGYDPGALALLRFIVASLAMGIVYFRLPQRQDKSLKEIFQLLLLGVYGIGLYSICLNYGEMTVTAGVASFIVGLMPVATILLSMWLYNEKYESGVWSGIAVAVVGMTLIAIGENQGGFSLLGVFSVLIASVLGALYTVMQKPLLEKFHPIEITTYVMWGGSICLLFFGLNLPWEITKAPWSATLAAVYMGVFPAAIAYLAWCYVISNMNPAKAALTMYGLPLVSTLMGMVVLNESPPLISIIGGTIAILGAFLTGI